MLQIIGKCCVFGGLSVIGFFLSLGLHRRVSCLREFLRGLEVLERELAFALPPVEQLMERLLQEAGEQSRGFYLSCRERFCAREEERFGEIWSSSLTKAELPLEGDDLGLLFEVGGIIGRYDGDSQRLALRRIHDRISEQIITAKDDARRMGKVYGTLGVSLGLFAVIML